MSVLQSAIAAASGSAGPTAYQIERSLRFNSADSAYLAWVPPQAGNRRTWTWSGWVKRSALGAYQSIFSVYNGSTNNDGLAFTAADKIEFYSIAAGAQRLSTAVYRDVSAWYHVVLAIDTPNATAQNRARIWVNGVEITVWDTNATITQNTEYFFNSVNNHHIGRYQSGGHYNGYITEVNFIDGQALTPSDFGETASATGVWIPKAYAGTYGQNGFYLPFNDNSAPVNLGRNRQTLTADPYFPYTTLLLNGNQPSGVTDTNNNVFKDSSSNNFTITRNGGNPGMTQGTFSPFSQTGWGNFFDGASYLTPSSSPLALGTAAYTVEFWIYPTTLAAGGYHVLAANATNGFVVVINNAKIAINKFGVGDVLAYNTALTLNTWTHVALVRTGTGANQTQIYVNGTSVATGTDSNNWTVTSTTAIGANSSGTPSQYITAYLSNLRICGAAVYTSNFTPSTTPLTTTSQGASSCTFLICQDNRFRDNGSTAATFTVGGTPSVQAFSPFAPTAAYSATTNGGSGYFDGTGDYLRAPSTTTSVFGLDTSNFTYETWIYIASAPSSGTITFIDMREPSGGIKGFTAGYTSTGNIQTLVGAPTAWNVNQSFAVNVGQWVHYALTRSSNVFRIFINGELKHTSATITGSLGTESRSAYIGSNISGAEIFNGYISGSRLVIGGALYTATFSVPTSPPTTTVSAGTAQLLLNYTNAGIIDSTGKNALETVGNTTISTTQSKFGGSSMYFDGTGDWLVWNPASVKTLDFGTGDFTIECWIYLNSSATAAILSPDGTNRFTCTVNYVSGQLSFYDNSTTTVYSTSGASITTGSWTHIAWVRSSGTLAMYVNGTSYYSASRTTNFGPMTTARIGADIAGAGVLNGYIDDLRITKGLARYTGNFTVPAAQFAYNTADINVKQWTPNSFSVTAGTGNDSLVDSPTNYGTDTGAGGEVRGNYCTLNPTATQGTVTLANGNLDITNAANSLCNGTVMVTSGKWYWEVKLASGSDYFVGAQRVNLQNIPTNKFQVAGGAFYYSANGNKYMNGDGGSAYGASYTTNDVIGVALNLDANTLTFYKNNVSQGAITIVAGDWVPCSVTGGTQCAYEYNFGQRPFAYTAPSGFKALCTQNLPTPAIGASASTLASKNFDVTLWTGDGAATKTVSGLAFQPDVIWNKSRSGAYSHCVYDVLRGFGITKAMPTNSTTAEGSFNDNATSGYVNSVTSDGYVMTKGSTGEYTNQSSVTYVGWVWKANGAGSSNTAGSINSTVSANQTAGISVVTWTGNGSNSDQTVGTGLSTALDFIITKPRDTGAGTDSWLVYTSAITLNQNEGLILNSTAAKSTNLDQGTPSRGATAGLLLLRAGTGAGVNNQNLNKSGIRYVSYCFHQVAGFSKFGSYTGNGNADGPFVYCGFRPRFVMIKNASNVANWTIVDTSRNTYNVANARLFPSNPDAESTAANNCDILSNGFKVRNGTDTGVNTNNETYIFAVFAESPFNYSRAR